MKTWQKWVMVLLCPLAALGAFTICAFINFQMKGLQLQSIQVEVRPDAYKPYSLTFVESIQLQELAENIRDSLLEEGEPFSRHIPYGLDSVSLRLYRNFNSSDGVIYCDFFLECEACGAGSGTTRLLVAMIDPDDLTYRFVSEEIVPWDCYLNSWVPHSPQWKGEEANP